MLIGRPVGMHKTAAMSFVTTNNYVFHNHKTTMPSLAAKQLCLSQQNTNIYPQIKTKKAKCQDHKRTRKTILGTLVQDVADEIFLKGFTQNDIDKVRHMEGCVFSMHSGPE